MPKKQPDLEIIILTYNSQFWLKKTLTSLKQAYLSKTKTKVKVTVVDNASQDDTSKMVKKSFSWAHYIQLDDNKGFAAGNNVALKKVKARYCMLLNSDVELTQKSDIDQLIAYMEANPKIGVVSPRLEFVSGMLDPASHRGEPTLWASFTYFAGLEKLFPDIEIFSRYHLLTKDLSQIHEIDACSGAGMLIRTSAMQKVGLMDERFFMYAEDIDWCRRFRQHAYKIVFYPLVTIIHHKYKSGLSSNSKAIARKTHHNFYDTMLQYYDKHYKEAYPKWVRTLVVMSINIKKGV